MCAASCIEAQGAKWHEPWFHNCGSVRIIVVIPQFSDNTYPALCNRKCRVLHRRAWLSLRASGRSRSVYGSNSSGIHDLDKAAAIGKGGYRPTVNAPSAVLAITRDHGERPPPRAGP
jgi:hypothetical protein